MDKILSTEETIQLAEKVRIELFMKNIKQTDLIRMLAERGIKASAPNVSMAINGKGFQPGFKKLLIAIDEILKEV